jgi:hypothetical protein
MNPLMNPLFIPSTSGPSFYAWDQMLNMWPRTTKQEINNEPTQYVLHQTEAEEKEEPEAQDNEDTKSQWEDEEDKLYNTTPQASPPPSPTPMPPPHYEEEWVDEWFNKEEDIYMAFPMPPLPLLPLFPIPCPLQLTPLIEQSPLPLIHSHSGMPITDEEVDAKLHNNPF